MDIQTAPNHLYHTCRMSGPVSKIIFEMFEISKKNILK